MVNINVSVIIPTYNRASLLPRAIDSVLIQTFVDFELIIINDASTDNTEEVVNEYLTKDTRVKYICNKNNLHAQEARNKAIRSARGKYIASLDDDDFWMPQKLELQMHLATTQNYAIIGCGHSYDLIPPQKVISLNRISFREKSIEEFGFSNRGFSPSKMLIPREYLLEIGGYDSSIPGPEGIDVFYRIVSRFGKAAWITEVLCVHQTNHGFDRITDDMIEYCKRELVKNAEFRSKSAKKYRMAQIYLMEHSKSNNLSEKAYLLWKFWSGAELKHLTNYLYLFFTKMAMGSKIMTGVIICYRRLKLLR